ncbi:VRR-NUC domain-containing protein (plasmid) [Corynebacterium mustelae]|uniref:VRR-NUC domain-containing protein n=1 Tax=Corynebacterium mustelae TaxID=571915 RepID=A0A0G3H089_9CORY|nr:VRR-NUC domain-containing protein [Corynebacterium mustelae]AKK05223.1 VRR-NUC domain-containing protein [Corynebacterium mustelae]AKK07451.1 VRR-NUC domain-containing protein [Corynebacterium mustelae]
MDEKHVEQALTRAVKNLGGLCLKFTSPGLAGVPDRLILLPGGCIAFAELKAPGKKPRPIQRVRKNQIENLGVPVHIIDHPNHIHEVLHEIQTTQLPTRSNNLH